MTLYDLVADYEVTIESVESEHRERDTSSDFTRKTSIVHLAGNGEVGRGEDVTYETELHEDFEERLRSLSLPGTYTLDEFSAHLADQALFVTEPNQSIFRNYRRWAFESAALDLALKQAGETLASALEETYDPVRFVVSTRLGEPPTTDRIEAIREVAPEMEFKLDPTDSWTADLVQQLTELGGITTLDLKGQYKGTEVDQSADPELYERVITGFPRTLIEDPELTAETRQLFEGEKARVTWDYPIRSVESVEKLPWQPCWLNIKPSRFGSLRALFETIEYCQENDIRMFGGGQFELGVGRQHLHALASVFYPAAPNDVAPSGYNEPSLPSNLPSSPLTPPAEPTGLEWNPSAPRD